MYISKILFFLNGILKRIKFKGFLFTINEMYTYVHFYNQILKINDYSISLKRKLSHFTFYSRISFLYPYLETNELKKIVPRSLTHSIYEKFKINRKDLTYDKLKMYQRMIDCSISIPRTYIIDKEGIQCIQSSKKLSIDEVEDKLISKPRFSNGGNGIEIIEKHEIKIDEGVLYQEVIRNHEEINKIQGNYFCSTLRFVFYNTDQINAIGATFQFNLGSVIDHMMKGGSISVSVDAASGKLDSKGFNSKGQIFNYFPKTGIAFSGFQLPFWKDVLNEIQLIGRNFPTLPIIAVDLCICQTKIVILEINAGCGTIAGQLDKGWLDHTFFKDYYNNRPNF